MKYLFVIYVFFLFSACSSLQKVSYSGEQYEVTKSLNQFLNHFEQATLYHNKEQLIGLLDLSYKKKRYETLKSHEDKEHFFREFYCGKEIKTNQSVCPAFNEVIYMEFISLEETEVGKYNIKYLIHTSIEDMIAEWVVNVSEQNDIEFLGIHTSFYKP